MFPVRDYAHVRLQLSFLAAHSSLLAFNLTARACFHDVEDQSVRLFFQSLFQSLSRLLVPCLHYVVMSLNQSRAVAKAAGKAKAKARGKARAKATAKAKQRVRTAAKNQRRGERRRCVQKLNLLAAELGAARIHLDR